jgi:hypothetical protein
MTQQEKDVLVESLYGKQREFLACCAHMHMRGANDVVIEIVPIIKQLIDAGIPWSYVAPPNLSEEEIAEHLFWQRVHLAMTDPVIWETAWKKYEKGKVKP